MRRGQDPIIKENVSITQAILLDRASTAEDQIFGKFLERTALKA
jgi:hypothetical protein